MRSIFLSSSLLLFTNLLHANESKVCQKCHPIIYDEYYKSSHRNASVYNNPVHKAMWEKHPKNKEGYTCAKCHSPSDKEALSQGRLTQNEVQLHEPISCVYCHTIKEVKSGESSNTNILTQKKRKFYTAEEGKKGTVEYQTKSSWFGLLKEPQSSPFHKIDYDNENYYSGNVCMGCHSHVNNEHGLDVTMLDALIDKNDKNSCVTCHMPQVLGTKVTINETKTHAYHGIAGIYHKNKKMGEYIDFKVAKTAEGLSVEVINKSNHALFGQVFRQGILKVQIQRGQKIIELEPFIFERIVGRDGNDSMPFNANEVLKDTLIYAKKELFFNEKIQKNDTVTLSLGVQRISQTGIEKLGLKENKELTKFRVLKSEKFTF